MSGVKISKSDAEWRQQLTTEQFRVTASTVPSARFRIRSTAGQGPPEKRYCMNGVALSFEAAATDGRSR